MPNDNTCRYTITVEPYTVEQHPVGTLVLKEEWATMGEASKLLLRPPLEWNSATARITSDVAPTPFHFHTHTHTHTARLTALNKGKLNKWFDTHHKE